MDAKSLNIIDNDGKIIGIEKRENIHGKGLLHMEVHVWFVTPQREIIFQHRSKTKDTYPDLLDATVGGHVEIGSTYLETAIKETKEETGLKLSNNDLTLIKTIKTSSNDHVTGKINNTLRAVYYHQFKGKISDLISEAEKGLGFETISIEKLRKLDNATKDKIIPNLTSKDYIEMFEEMVRKDRDLAL